MSDLRFARLKTDPRFRRIRKHNSKLTIDERFKGVFEQDEKKAKKTKGRVDKYGRALSKDHERENLRRFYRLENEDKSVPPPLDLARGEVLLESSDEEDDQQHSENDSSDDGADQNAVVTLGSHQSRPIPLADEEQDINLDENNFADLDAQAEAYAKANRPEDETSPSTTPTKRLAVVNLDWDHVKAIHLYRIFSSLVSLTAPPPVSSLNEERKKSRADSKTSVVRGRVLSVRVYPSDFGRERLAREEREGPPPELFKRSKQIVDEDEVDERTVYEVGNEDDFDEDALRKYQLERLRYYYAIVVCDTADTASHIYSELEGTEIERSANVFDMSFVPDDMIFDQEFRDEVTEDANAQFKPLDFTTDALRHSKVKLTWDQDDPERNRFTRRALSRKEIDEDDFKAYVASSSSEAEEDTVVHSKGKRSADRDKLRALLLGGSKDELPEGWGDFDGKRERGGDMEITFTPGLSTANGDGEETTLEKYQRKMKEKRKKRKEVMKEKGKDHGPSGRKRLEDDLLDDRSDESSDDALQDHLSKKPENKRNQSEVTDDDGSRPSATPEELALLFASDNPTGAINHFDMSAVLKSEKKKGKKKVKGKKAKQLENDELQEDFVIDVNDDRFKVLHEDHTFAIDPSNPYFKKSKSMTALLEERSKRQKAKHEGGEISAAGKTRITDREQRNLQSLVESVKRKSTAADGQGLGKRKRT